MNWMILPLKRYADFQGRSRRLEYWMFTLFLTLVSCALALLLVPFGAFSDPADGAPFAFSLIAVFGLLALAVIIPSIAVVVRRLHDLNLSGWLYLIAFIPYLGGLILFVMMLIPGTKGDNRYGPDPKQAGGPGDLERVFG